MTTRPDSGQLLRRFASLGLCPQCRNDLDSALHSGSTLECDRCGYVIQAGPGFILALPPSHPVSQSSAGLATTETGWAVGIAADMNQKSATYGRKYEEYTLASRGFIVRQSLALELVGPQPGRVLEAGCGPGVVGPALASLGADVHGVDLSAEQLRLAAAASIQGLYAQGDLEKLPYRDAVFDTVVVLGVFEYLEKPEAALREMVRVTRTGGQIIFTLPNAQGLARIWTQRAYIPLGHAYKRARGKPVPAYSRTLYKRSGFVALLEREGLRVRSTRLFDIVLTPPPFERAAPRCTIRLVDALEARLKGTVRLLTATQFVVSAEKTSAGRQVESQDA